MFKVRTRHSKNNGNTNRLVCQIFVYTWDGITRLACLGWVKRSSAKRGQYRQLIVGKESNIVESVEKAGSSFVDVMVSEEMYISLNLSELIRYWKQGLDIRSPWLQSIFLELTPRIYKLKRVSSDHMNQTYIQNANLNHSQPIQDINELQRVTFLVLERKEEVH